MTNQRVADRYAKSLLDLAIERGQLEAVKRDVDNLLGAAKNRDLQMLLASPVVAPSKKKSILNEILAKAGANELTMLFTDILVNKGRDNDLMGIFAAWDRQYKELNKISTVRVTSATQLTDAELRVIESRLIESGMTEASVDLETSIDPTIIGGFILEFDGKVYDASVRHQLGELRKEIA